MVRCCVPGCGRTRDGSGLRFFAVQNPNSAPTEEIKHHRLALANFVLAVGINIAMDKPLSPQLCICERHFKPEDIMRRGVKGKSLKTGAMPCRNLPSDLPPVIPIKELPLMYNKQNLKVKDIGHCCHIPGCLRDIFYETRKTGVQYKYTGFQMKNPKYLSQGHPHREWMVAVFKFMMNLTNQKLADSYHRDCVKICEKHFASADMSYTQGTKRLIKKLRIGAMPSMHVPEPEPENETSITSRPTPLQKFILAETEEDELKIKHKTFSCLSASARKISHKSWQISTKNAIVKCIKPSADCCDQNEIILEIDKAFNVGIIYYGWCLPENHFATTFKVQQNGLVQYLDYLEALTPCEGIKLPGDLKQPKEVVLDHFFTKSSSAFEYKPIVTTLLCKRSRDCDVLLPAPSFGICKTCTIANENLTKELIREEKLTQAKIESFTYDPCGDDSQICARLKKELWSKKQELRMISKDLRGNLNVAKDRTQKNQVTKVQSKIAGPKTKMESLKKSLKSKLVTIDEYMQPITTFAEVQKLPRSFLVFWQFHVNCLWKGLDGNISKCATRYPDEVMDIYADLYMKSRSAYQQLRDQKLLQMPVNTSIKKYSVKRHAKLVQLRDEQLMQVVKNTSQSTLPESTNLIPSTERQPPENNQITNTATESEIHNVNSPTTSIPVTALLTPMMNVDSVENDPGNITSNLDKNSPANNNNENAKCFALCQGKRKMVVDSSDEPATKMIRIFDSTNDVEVMETAISGKTQEFTNIVIEVDTV